MDGSIVSDGWAEVVGSTTRATMVVIISQHQQRIHLRLHVGGVSQQRADSTSSHALPHSLITHHQAGAGRATLERRCKQARKHKQAGKHAAG